MGYHTEFYGEITITPLLNKKEATFLREFNNSRRMYRANGDYYVEGGKMPWLGDKNRNDDVFDANKPPAEQPGLWCGWTVTDDGSFIIWDGGEKFYRAAEWMWYIIQNFLKTNPIAKLRHPDKFNFMQGHTCNGEITAQGEDHEDKWLLMVNDNEVKTRQSVFSFKAREPVGDENLKTRYCFETNKGSRICGECEKRFECYTNAPTTFWL